jgi:hypothetical protein
MPRLVWPLLRDRPRIQVELTMVASGQQVVRNLLADTGAGAAHAGVDLLLAEHDCLHANGMPAKRIALGGSYVGSFRLYLLRVQIPALGFDRDVRAVGVSRVPAGFDGLACFPFLNRFTYGNFGDSSRFGLEV